MTVNYSAKQLGVPVGSISMSLGPHCKVPYLKTGA